MHTHMQARSYRMQSQLKSETSNLFISYSFLYITTRMIVSYIVVERLRVAAISRKKTLNQCAMCVIATQRESIFTVSASHNLLHRVILCMCLESLRAASCFPFIQFSLLSLRTSLLLNENVILKISLWSQRISLIEAPRKHAHSLNTTQQSRNEERKNHNSGKFQRFVLRRSAQLRNRERDILVGFLSTKDYI